MTRVRRILAIPTMIAVSIRRRSRLRRSASAAVRTSRISPKDSVASRCPSTTAVLSAEISIRKRCAKTPSVKTTTSAAAQARSPWVSVARHRRHFAATVSSPESALRRTADALSPTTAMAVRICHPLAVLTMQPNRSSLTSTAPAFLSRRRWAITVISIDPLAAPLAPWRNPSVRGATAARHAGLRPPRRLQSLHHGARQRRGPHRAEGRRSPGARLPQRDDPTAGSDFRRPRLRPVAYLRR